MSGVVLKPLRFGEHDRPPPPTGLRGTSEQDEDRPIELGEDSAGCSARKNASMPAASGRQPIPVSQLSLADTVRAPARPLPDRRARACGLLLEDECGAKPGYLEDLP